MGVHNRPGYLAKGIDPQQKSAQIDPATAKLIPVELLPQELRKIFPDGVIERTVGALLGSLAPPTRRAARDRSYFR